MPSKYSGVLPRPEHPRPDFMRDTFCNLNGVWQFAFDDGNAGLREGWYRPGKALPLEITVPFAYQTKLSGLGPTDEIHPVIWYRRSFTVPQVDADSSEEAKQNEEWERSRVKPLQRKETLLIADRATA